MRKGEAEICGRVQSAVKEAVMLNGTNWNHLQSGVQSAVKEAVMLNTETEYDFGEIPVQSAVKEAVMLNRNSCMERILEVQSAVKEAVMLNNANLKGDLP